jgi:16S rRNA (guanine527-N7)-methyltransferase
VPNSIEKLLAKALTKNNYHYSQQLQNQLCLYLDLMQRWNQVFNLTAIRTPEDMVWLHIMDSLSIAPFLQGERIIDIGTGAGLPGIPLSLTHPHLHFTLLDSNSKKTRFLMQTVAELKLTNVEVIHARCEDFKPKVKFDSIVSRAFSSITVMLAGTQHLLADQGQFLAMKGVYPEQELAHIPSGFIVSNVHKLTIKGLAAERHVACIHRK